MIGKELQDLAWSCLPKEFKKEVKKEYRKCLNEPWCVSSYLRGRLRILRELFGEHNLTSDAEGEEMLTANKKDVQEQYALQITALQKGNLSDLEVEYRVKLKDMLYFLFGSKCLPDDTKDGTKDGTKAPKPAEPKFELDDIVRIKSNAAEYHQGYQNGYCWLPERDEYVGKLTTITNIRVYGDIELKISGEGITWEAIDLELYTEPKKESRNLSQETVNCDKQFDNILRNSFSKERRLNIATQILSGIVASSKPCKHPVKRALELTDSLMSECEKGGPK